MDKIAFIGLQVISTYIVTVSIAGNWTYYFGDEHYTLLNYISSCPNILVAIFIPKIMKWISIPKIAYGNATLQIFSCIMFIVPAFIANQKYAPGVSSPRTRNAFIVTIINLIISSTGFAVAQTAIFSLGAEFTSQTVQFYITGLAFANLLMSIVFFPINMFVASASNRQVLYYILPILIQILSFIVFHYLHSQVPNKQEDHKKVDEDIGTKADEHAQLSIVESFKVVIKTKWLFLTLNFLLFYTTFLVYPSMMFQMPCSEPALKDNWGTILMFIFGVSEVGARLMNTMGVKGVTTLITEKSIWIFCLVRYVISLTPMITYLAGKGMISMSPVLMDVLNCFLYAILAFTLGIIGNNIAIYMYSGLDSERKIQVAGSLFNLSIVTSISLGQLSSHFIIKAISSAK